MNMKSIYDENKRFIRKELIKPCPFCGCNDRLVIRYERDYIDREDMYTVECVNCGGSMTSPSDTERKAVNRWNKRKCGIN